MCLINELARFNRLVHQYRLTDETGPAHKRTFTVCLKLGGEGSANASQEPEEYLASGPSIKKAQHAAAAIAMEKTQLKHPPPKLKLAKNSEETKSNLFLDVRNSSISLAILFQPTSLPRWS